MFSLSVARTYDRNHTVKVDETSCYIPLHTTVTQQQLQSMDINNNSNIAIATTTGGDDPKSYILDDTTTP